MPQLVNNSTLNDMRVLLGENFSVLLVKYFEMSEGLIRAMQQAVKAGDKTIIHRSVHSLKSASAQLGAELMHAKAQTLEKLAEQGGGDMQAIKLQLTELTEIYAQTSKQLRRALG